MWSVFPRLVVVAGGLGLTASVFACSSAVGPEPWQTGDSADGGSSTSSSGSPSPGGSTSSSGSSSGSGASTSSSGSGGGSGSTSSSGGSSTSSGSGSGGGATDASVPADAGVDSGTVSSDDGFGAQRTVCINTINQYRTSIGLPAYTLVNTTTTNTCVDTQANNDQAKDSAHYSFINNDPSCTWGQASGFAQDECPDGWGTTAAGLTACLKSMWDEQNNANCKGCIGCTAFGGACPGCDYSGTMGPECGHYVNMSAPYFTSVACGFGGATPSSSTGWMVQDFE